MLLTCLYLLAGGRMFNSRRLHFRISESRRKSDEVLVTFGNGWAWFRHLFRPLKSVFRHKTPKVSHSGGMIAPLPGRGLTKGTCRSLQFALCFNVLGNLDDLSQIEIHLANGNVRTSAMSY